MCHTVITFSSCRHAIEDQEFTPCGNAPQCEDFTFESREDSDPCLRCMRRDLLEVLQIAREEGLEEEVAAMIEGMNQEGEEGNDGDDEEEGQAGALVDEIELEREEENNADDDDELQYKVDEDDKEWDKWGWKN